VGINVRLRPTSIVTELDLDVGINVRRCLVERGYTTVLGPSHVSALKKTVWLLQCPRRPRGIQAMPVSHCASTEHQAVSVGMGHAPVFKPHAVRRDSRCVDQSDGLSAVDISDFNLKRPESRPVRMVERLVRFRESDGRLIYTDFLAALESQPRHTSKKRVARQMLSDPGMFDNIQSLQHNTTLLGVVRIASVNCDICMRALESVHLIFAIFTAGNSHELR